MTRTARPSVTLLALLAFVLLNPMAAHAAAPAPSPGPTRSAPPLGTFPIFHPPVPPRGVVALFSGKAGWTPAMDAAATAIAEAGQLVVGIETSRLLDAAGSSDSRKCLELARPLASAIAAALAGDSQASELVDRGRGPILAGAGDAAALAYAVLAQAPVGLFTGAIGVDFNGEAAGTAPLCAGAEAERVAPGIYRYPPKDRIPGWVRLVTGDPEDPLLVPYALEGGATIVAVRGAGDLAAAVITALADAHRAPLTGLAGAGAGAGVRVEDMPLVPMPVEPPGKTMAIVYSGDGGWRDADKSIGEALRASGVPVVGVDSLRYFWHEKTPEEIAAGLDAILEYYPRTWHRPQVLLIGYSFGADVMPFVIGKLRPENRARIAQISLVGFAARADFQIQVASWLGDGPSEDALPVLPELAKLDLSLVQCFYGVEEQDTACTDPALKGAEIVALPGGHHFDGDYGVLARRILDGARRRTDAEPTH